MRGGRSVHVGDDAVGHALAVLVPSHAVLPPALALVSGLPVHEQHGEVHHVEVGQDVLKTWGATGTAVSVVFTKAHAIQLFCFPQTSSEGPTGGGRGSI